MIDIRQMSCVEFFANADTTSLLKEYAVECSIAELGPALPQPDIYEAISKSGGLYTFGAFVNDILTGFAVVLVYVLPHYGQRIAATESIFAARGSNGTGAALMQAIEKHAKSLECKAFLYSAPVGSRFANLLAQRYKHTSSVYFKDLA